jgi:hypothetical protein
VPVASEHARAAHQRVANNSSHAIAASAHAYSADMDTNADGHTVAHGDTTAAKRARRADSYARTCIADANHCAVHADAHPRAADDHPAAAHACANRTAHGANRYAIANGSS